MRHHTVGVSVRPSKGDKVVLIQGIPPLPIQDGVVTLALVLNVEVRPCMVQGIGPDMRVDICVGRAHDILGQEPHAVRQVQPMHLGGGIETAGVFGAVVVAEVCLAPQGIETMHLMEGVDAAEVAVVAATPAGRDADGLRRILAHRQDLAASQRNWSGIIQGGPGAIDFDAGFLAVDGGGIPVEEGGVHPLRCDPYVHFVQDRGYEFSGALGNTG